MKGFRLVAMRKKTFLYVVMSMSLKVVLFSRLCEPGVNLIKLLQV